MLANSSSSESLLTCQGLTFAWRSGSAPLFEDLSFSLQPGHIYGLLGRNGAGKTSLLKLLTGCLRPSGGQVSVFMDGGRLDPGERHPASLAETVFVPESSPFPAMQTRRFGVVVGALYPRFSQEKYIQNLQAFEVRADAKLGELSFGQKRKTHIAFALATDARLIILDEPTNGLDIAAQIVFRKLLVTHLTPDRSIVISTHHVREFETIVDHAIVLEKGRLLAFEPVETLENQGGFTGLETWYAQLIGLTSSGLPKGEI